MHCVHKAGGWQPKAAGGWFALLTAIVKLIDFKAISILLGFVLILLIRQIERIVISAFNLKVKGLLILNLIL
jgi:hypothetical protein